MAKNNFHFSIWQMEFLHLQCGTIMTLISPGDCTLQCGMWLWNRDSKFTKWQHPAMSYVALGWRHWIRQVAAPCNVTRSVALQSRHWIRQVAAPWSVAGGSGMTCHWIRPNVHHIGILHLVLILTTSPHSTWYSAPVSKIFIQIGLPSAEKNDIMSIFKMADFSHLGF